MLNWSHYSIIINEFWPVLLAFSVKNLLISAQKQVVEVNNTFLWNTVCFWSSNFIKSKKSIKNRESISSVTHLLSASSSGRLNTFNMMHRFLVFHISQLLLTILTAKFLIITHGQDHNTTYMKPGKEFNRQNKPHITIKQFR